ncbi:MAG: endonuclease, partial [Rhodocyclaceae bacterium]|nr:endonuclease [Rhodocyclaceae bacterium]
LDAWQLVHADVPHAPTVGVHEASFSAGPQTYDFFFVSANLAERVKDVSVDLVTMASDHQPMALTVA